MAKDERLWMRFPIDMHRHPLFLKLDPEVRWTFVEMNGEARIARNDGIFQEADAEFMWPVEHLTALVKSHPRRALVLHKDGCYIIREYGQHQFTEADREALAEVSRMNGKKGGRPRKPETQQNPAVTQPGFGQVRNGTQTNPEVTHSIAESESESEIETDSYNTGSVSPVSDRARVLGLTDRAIRSIINAASLHCDIDATDDEAVELGAHILGKSRTAVKSPAAYVRNAIETGPSEIDAWFRAHRRTHKAARA
jgi:hypothetical protein